MNVVIVVNMVILVSFRALLNFFEFGYFRQYGDSGDPSELGDLGEYGNSCDYGDSCNFCNFLLLLVNLVFGHKYILQYSNATKQYGVAVSFLFFETGESASLLISVCT